MVPSSIDALLQTLHELPVDSPRYHTRGSPLTTEGIVYHYTSFAPQFPYVPEGMLLDREDTPYGLVLVAERKHQRKNVALLGFQAEDTAITIVRLQGARGSYRELTPLDWGRALVEPAITLAQEAGFSQAAFYPAARAADLDEKNEHTLQKRYNATALRCGFSWNEDLQLFVKPLHKQQTES